jgi:actin-like ATPase involved in cell morphogenesis
MSYHLGIDLGTTYAAAAVHDGSPTGRPEVVPLGERGPSVPSVLLLAADGGFLAGDAAERHAVTDPQRIARLFKRRLGDPTPLLVGDASIPAEVLTGRLLRWVVDTVVRLRGARPATIALSHPANWGPYKRDLLDKAAEIAGVPEVVMVTEPQAAAISYSSQSRVDVGSVVAVYDLGGGTFDAAVLRKEADGGFTVLGSPEGIEHLGGIDIDAAVFARVCQEVEEAYEALDPDDPQALAAVSRLRSECTQAKEALSLDTEISVPVLLPTIQTEVRVTRAELEEMIRPTLSETVTAMDRALRSASVAAADVDHVLLVGGSSRIPLVAELVSSGLGRPVAVDAHPKHAIALGAAIVAARAAGAPVGAALPPPPGAGVTAGVATAAGAWGAASATSPPGAPAFAGPGTLPPPSRPAPPAGPATRPAPPAAAPPGPTRPPRPAPPAAAAPPGGPTSPPPGYAGAAPPPPATPGRPAPPGAGPAAPPPPGGGWTPGGANRPPAYDPTFEAAASEAPPPSLGYRAASMPPTPGTSGELPPGYLTGEAKQAKRRRDRRKRRLMVVLGALLVVAAVGATVVMTALSNQPDTVADLEVGECFTGEATDLQTVDCADAHTGELFALAPPTDPEGAFPGEDALRDQAGSVCVMELTSYYGAPVETALENGIEVSPVTPSESQWDEGETDTFCLAVSSEGGALGASIKDQGAG